jgi:hypothetical protein
MVTQTLSSDDLVHCLSFLHALPSGSWDVVIARLLVIGMEMVSLKALNRTDSTGSLLVRLDYPPGNQIFTT